MTPSRVYSSSLAEPSQHIENQEVRAFPQFHSLVLLRAALGVQSNRCRSLSDSTGGTRSCSGYHQPKARRRSSPAHEASDSGLLSPELAAGIQRVKGAKQLGRRSSNWLSLEPSSALLGSVCGDGLRDCRDHALLRATACARDRTGPELARKTVRLRPRRACVLVLHPKIKQLLKIQRG